MPDRVTAESSYFAIAVSEIRGFDLGDDAELLADLNARRESDPTALEGDDWLLLGVLAHRRAEREVRGSSDPEAVACFERAAAMGHREGLAHFLRGTTLLRLGRLDAAQKAFEQAQHQPADDGSCPPAELTHARGHVALAQGELERALELFREGLDADPSSAARWMDTARLLLRLERFDEAAEAVTLALADDPDDVDALYEQAALAARRGDRDTVIETLAKAIGIDSNLRAWATDDPRFDTMRDTAELDALLASSPPPDLRWLDALASWMATLRRDEELLELGISWLGLEESERIAAEVNKMHERGPSGTMHTETTLARSRDLLRGKRPVALGPATRTREHVTERSLLWVDLERPNQLWLGLSRSYAPFLWLPAGTTPDALRIAVLEHFPPPRRDRLQMPQVSRGFMGYRLRFGVPNPYTGKVEPANAHELDRHFNVNPFVEAAFWGSAYDDDPWPDEIPPQPGYLLKMSARQRRFAEQARGQVWSVSRRTRHSRSCLTIELHHRDIYVVEVRYRPSRHTSVVDRLNADLGSDYPTDMPVDAIAALMGFQFEQADDLQARIDATADPEEIAGLLLVLSALRHSDLSMTRVYRRYMDHPDSVVRTTLCNVFVAHNHESLLEEMSIIEPEDDIRSQVDAVLDEGIGIVQYDPYTDYEDGDIDFGGDDDDDDDIEVDLDTEDA